MPTLGDEAVRSSAFRFAGNSVLLALLAGLPCSSTCGQSRFDSIRSEVRTPSASTPDEPKKSKRDRVCPHGNLRDTCPLCEDDDEDDDVLGNILGEIVVSMFMSDSDEEATENVSYQIDNKYLRTDPYFAAYPYAEGLHGYLMDPDWVPSRPQNGAIRPRLIYGNDFDGIQSWGGDLVVEGAGGWGFDLEYMRFGEKLLSGGRDEIQIGDANLLYRFGRNERWLFRGGLGLAAFDDDVGTELGLNGTLMMDWFPAPPCIISTEFDIGKLGSASHVHVQSTIGLNWHRFEFFAGYDYRRIGSVNLHGPQFGVRGWW